MGKDSNIEWTDHTFNPWWGCAKISPACAHCYAEAGAKWRGHDVWSDRDGEGKRRELSETYWAQPLEWNREAEEAGTPARVFCASYADWAERHPTTDRIRHGRLWPLVRATPHLIWLMLTKRTQNIQDCLPPDWGMGGYHNVWLGATVENQHYAQVRIPQLLSVPAPIHFLSCEPLLGPVDLRRVDVNRNETIYPLTGHYEVSDDHGGGDDGELAHRIDWVIAGGESGPGARAMRPEWARLLRDQCQHAGVAFHFKQWGQHNAAGTRVKSKHDAGRQLDGVTWDEFPATQEAPSA